MGAASGGIFSPRGGSFSFFAGGTENKSLFERSSSKSPLAEDFDLVEELVVAPFTFFGLGGRGGAIERGSAG